MEHIRGEACIEEIHYRVRIHVPHQDQQIWVLTSWLSGNRARLQDELVGAERSIFKEHELVFMRGVERASVILSDRKVEGLDAEGGRVGTVVGVDLELGAAETGLDVGRRGGEDGFVGEGYFVGDGVACGVELLILCQYFVFLVRMWGNLRARRGRLGS